MGAAAIVVTCGRLLIRWRYYGTFKADDIFNTLALLLLFAFFIVTDLLGWDPAIENDFVATNNFQLATNLLMWTTIYAVKASFLALLWNVFSVSANFRRLWWVITVYTFLTFWVIFLSEFWQCGSPTNYADSQACFETKENSLISTPWVGIPLWPRAFLHISSDIFIMLLPIAQIRKLHMSTFKKIGVVATFALILINIAMGLVKSATVLYLYVHGGSSDIWSLVWMVLSYVEPALAVIVCALPAYRILLPSSNRRRRSDEQRLAPNAADIEAPRKAMKTSPKAPDYSLLQVTEATRSHVEEPQAAYIVYRNES